MLPVGKIGIPAAREFLLQVADAVEAGVITPFEAAEHIRWTIPHLTRNSAKRRAPTQSRKVPPWLASKLRAEMDRNPDIPMQSIAEQHGTNSGRASEALHHLR